MPKKEKDQSRTPKAPQRVGNKTPCKNLEQQKIEIYEDKLLLILIRNQPIADRWKSPLSVLGILLTLLIALVTSTFHDFLGLNKDFWKAFFNICTFVVSGVLVYFLCVAKARKFTSPEELVRLIANRPPEGKKTATKPELRRKSKRNGKRSLPRSRSPRSYSRWAAFKNRIRSSYGLK